MAIVLKNSNYDIKLDTNTIIGVMGNNYERFFSQLSSDEVYYLDKKYSVSNRKVNSLLGVNDLSLIKEFDLQEDILNKRIKELSHSEQKLVKYILLMLYNKKINIIDEPFLDLDYHNKKIIILLINRLIKENKTIIIGSVNSNIIYELCKKVLFIEDNLYYYGDVNVFQNNKVLDKYHIEKPNLVNFVSLARKKKPKFRYSYDIRDLIKDVYRNVSKK